MPVGHGTDLFFVSCAERLKNLVMVLQNAIPAAWRTTAEVRDVPRDVDQSRQDELKQRIGGRVADDAVEVVTQHEDPIVVTILHGFPTRIQVLVEFLQLCCRDRTNRSTKDRRFEFGLGRKEVIDVEPTQREQVGEGLAHAVESGLGYEATAARSSPHVHQALMFQPLHRLSDGGPRDPELVDEFALVGQAFPGSVLAREDEFTKLGGHLLVDANWADRLELRCREIHISPNPVF